MTCDKCHYWTAIPAHRTDKEFTLGRKSLVAIPFPQTRYHTQWSPPAEPNPPTITTTNRDDPEPVHAKIALDTASEELSDREITQVTETWKARRRKMSTTKLKGKGRMVEENSASDEDLGMEIPDSPEPSEPREIRRPSKRSQSKARSM